MKVFWVAALPSALICALLLPLCSCIGVRVGAVDLPDGGRKRHPYATPRFSGPALYVAMALPMLFLPMAEELRVSLLSGGALVVALGITDDVGSLSPRARLLAEAVIAILPLSLGLFPHEIWVLGRALPLPPLVSAPLAVLWVMTLTNAYNLIDGLDGLCVTQGAVTALWLSQGGAPAALPVLGACLGFLPYNRSAVLPIGGMRHAPTAAFLGDGGALLLGYMLSVLSLSLPLSVAHPLFFLVPLYDLVTSVLRRLRAHKGIFAADRGHLHHRLLGCGFSAEGVLFLLMTAAAACGMIGSSVLP